MKKRRKSTWYPKILALALALLVVGISVYTAHSHTQVSFADSVDIDTDENVSAAEYTQAAAAALALPAARVSYQVTSSTPQFVIFSFDGSKSVEMLNETLAFEQHMQAEGKPIKFTYFINAVYFLTKENARLYQAPGESAGVSRIGFSNSIQDIVERMSAFNTAYTMGNEIGSHSVGHFDGSKWSYYDWTQEFQSFVTLMGGVQQNNPTEKISPPIFLDSIHGFRAPNLGFNDNLYSVLSDFHFTYDSSQIGAPGAWPHKDDKGIWHIPLGVVLLGSNKTPVVSMDYNLWVRQSGAQELAKKGTPLWTSYFDSAKEAYINYFDTNYSGGRAPVIIAGHFSQWNDGVYWEVMKSVAEDVCGKPQVQCGTFSQLVQYLNTEGVPPKK